MDFDDYLQPEIAVTAAVTAVVFSPGARKLLRRGVVYGLAGALMAGDAITSFTRSIGRGVQEAVATLQSQAKQQKTSSVGQGDKFCRNSTKASSRYNRQCRELRALS